jgi:hypothetical protein
MNESRNRTVTLIAALGAGVLLLASCARSSPSSPRGGAASPLVDPKDIVPGGPPPDGIPPIDRPKFLSVSAVDFLSPREPVLAIDLNGDARAYPARILIWHEIANDVVGGVPVVVTYCPLCNSGVAFRRPTIGGDLLDFGTSGKLYNSNLVMYDRQTRSLWPQVLGKAVVGPLTGTTLEFVPIQLGSWTDWAAEHPKGKVLSTDTGHIRSYGANPYEGYDAPGSPPFLYSKEIDPRLPPKARVVGVQVGRDVVAFPYAALRSRAIEGHAAVATTVGGRRLVVFWEAGTQSAVDNAVISKSRDVGSTGVFDPELDGRDLIFTATAGGIVDEQTGSRWDILGRAVSGPLFGRHLNHVVSIESFWFNWAAFFPSTRIFGTAS